MSYEDPTILAPSAARTAAGQSSAFACPAGQRVAIWVNVTAASGTTPSMTLSVQWSQDGGVTWADGDPVDSLTAITAAGVKVKDFGRKAPMYRLSWTVSGTLPSFTFEARGHVVGS